MKRNFVNFIEITDKNGEKKFRVKKYLNHRKNNTVFFHNESNEYYEKAHEQNCSLGSKSSEYTRYFSYLSDI